MSSPQQPWSPDQPRPTEPQPADGYGAAQGRGAPQAYGPPQGYGTPQGYGAPPPGYAPAQGYGPPPQAQPQTQPYGGGPTGELVINLRRPFGAMGMISPVVTIDGQTAPCRWGRNSFQAPAGVRQVDVAQTYLWTYGRASMPVNVVAGSTSEVFYSGPMATFGLGGAIGTEPQRRPGTRIFIGLMVLVALVVLLAVVAVVAGSS